MQPTEAVTVRFQKKDKELLIQICEERGENISTFVRRAVLIQLAKLSYLPEAQKKALGTHA